MSDISIELTSEDELVLRNANKAYYNDLNAVANGEIDSVDDAGWRSAEQLSPIYLIMQFGKLSDAGLLEEAIDDFRWCITQRGMDTIAALDKAKVKVDFLKPVYNEFAQKFTPDLVKQIEAAKQTSTKQTSDAIDAIELIRAKLIDGQSFHDQLEKAHEEIERLNKVISSLNEHHEKVHHTEETALLHKDEEIRILNTLLDERNRLLAAIPECEQHGQCIPHALEWIEESKSIRADYKELVEKAKYQPYGNYDFDVLNALKFFVEGYWTTVHIGQRLNQLKVNVTDQHLQNFRDILSKALAARENGKWWLMEMNDGGRFAMHSYERPDTTRVLKQPAGIVGLTIEANTYHVVDGPFIQETIDALLNKPPQTNFVTVEPRKGMTVKTPNGKGKIEEVGDGYIIVDGHQWEPWEVTVLDVGFTVEPHDAWANNPKARPMPHPGTVFQGDHK